MNRPVPTLSLLELTNLSDLGIRLAPALEVWEWIQTEILAHIGSIHNEDHTHLLDADIRVMWASSSFEKQVRIVLGQAEQVAFRAGGWVPRQTNSTPLLSTSWSQTRMSPLPRTYEAPVRLTPKQANIYVWGFQRSAWFRDAVRGRRFGKTFLGKAEMRRAARLAAEWGESVEDEIWYAAPTQKQARRVFWRRLKQAIPREWREYKPNESGMLITLKSGHLIRCAGLMVNIDQCPQLTLCLERQTYNDKGEPDKDPKRGHDHMNDAAGYFIAKRYPIKAIVTSIKMGYAR